MSSLRPPSGPGWSRFLRFAGAAFLLWRVAVAGAYYRADLARPLEQRWQALTRSDPQRLDDTLSRLSSDEGHPPDYTGGLLRALQALPPEARVFAWVGRDDPRRRLAIYLHFLAYPRRVERMDPPLPAKLERRPRAWVLVFDDGAERLRAAGFERVAAEHDWSLWK